MDSFFFVATILIDSFFSLATGAPMGCFRCLALKADEGYEDLKLSKASCNPSDDTSGS
jgi:hypothetical protein